MKSWVIYLLFQRELFWNHLWLFLKSHWRMWYVSVHILHRSTYMYSWLDSWYCSYHLNQFHSQGPNVTACTTRLMFAEVSVLLWMRIFVDVYVFFFLWRGLWFYIIALFTFINFTRGSFLTFNHYFPSTRAGCSLSCTALPRTGWLHLERNRWPSFSRTGPQVNWHTHAV